MKHLMLDLYGVRADTNNLENINEIMNRIISELSLKAVMPVENLPYYYCPTKEDGGISSFCLLDNGHITLHTFPFFGNCYIDILFCDIDRDKAEALIKEIFMPERTDSWCFDRDNEECGTGYSPENGFGPHVLVETVAEKPYGIGDIYEMLEALPEKIEMHPIARPVVLTNRIRDYDVISGLTVIAESHLAIHHNINTGKTYFDIYSCKFCDSELLYDTVSKLFGDKLGYQLISRGEKQEKAIMAGYSRSDNGWRNNI